MTLFNPDKAKITEQRLWYAIEMLDKLKPQVEVIEYDEMSVKFTYKGHLVTHFAYTGWHTGKSIKDGRGVNKLLKQLK